MSLSVAENIVETLVLLFAAAAVISGLICVQRYKGCQVSVHEYCCGRGDAVMVAFATLSTAASLHHLYMMVEWTLLPGSLLVNAGFKLRIALVNITFSGFFIAGHVIAAICARTDIQARLRGIRILGGCCGE